MMDTIETKKNVTFVGKNIQKANMDILEKLAELEHEQWIEWSKDIADKEKLSEERLVRWKEFWVPYSKLDEKAKEEDRKWARKTLNIVSNERQGAMPTEMGEFAPVKEADNIFLFCDVADKGNATLFHIEYLKGNKSLRDVAYSEKEFYKKLKELKIPEETIKDFKGSEATQGEGKYGPIRLIELLETKKGTFRSFTGFVFRDSLWISPEGETINTGVMNHYEWILQNAEDLSQKYNIDKKELTFSDKDKRLDAILKVGFIRVQTVELRINFQCWDMSTSVPKIEDFLISQPGELRWAFILEESTKEYWEFTIKDFIDEGGKLKTFLNRLKHYDLSIQSSFRKFYTLGDRIWNFVYDKPGAEYEILVEHLKSDPFKPTLDDINTELAGMIQGGGIIQEKGEQGNLQYYVKKAFEIKKFLATCGFEIEEDFIEVLASEFEMPVEAIKLVIGGTGTNVEPVPSWSGKPHSEPIKNKDEAVIVKKRPGMEETSILEQNEFVENWGQG